MARSPNKFRNPYDDTEYEWPTNHLTEEAFGLVRNYERTAPTAGVGFVRQEGDPTPLTMKLEGTLLRQVEDSAFITWFNLGRTHTLHFIDWTGAEYEILFVSYTPQRERVEWNYRDPTMRTHIIRFTMEFEVLRVISGPWEDAA